ncbi:hypothetical protein QN277_023098 [Acacia crassicarpa]|uniref:Protein AATF n=1 Tax=Acacia crassicarpa TaxID=499986 RepID=A0AAE1MLN1_9FABA|nr:hypothetical protein QN277_023098 [Acacia crassicarpa]
MGLSGKRSRKTQNNDVYWDDYSDMENEQEFDAEDYDDDEVEDEDDEEGTYDEEDGTAEEDKGNDDEMEQLEKEYSELHKQQDNLKNLKRHKDEDLLKGQAVKNQKALWYKILELRFLLQKPYSSSNRLPQEPVRSSLYGSDEGVSAAYSALITSSKETLDSILELQEALLAQNPSIAQGSDVSERPPKHLDTSKNLDDNFDEEWSQISQMHKRGAPFRDRSINKWQRMTQVTTGAAAFKGKLQAFNQDISSQVATYMRDPSRMIKQMRLRRSAVNIFGNILEANDNSNEEKTHIDGDPELLDDSEFYQHLLREFFETVDPTSSKKALDTLRKMQPKKRKIVDRRASKSRKIRYNVHENIVNFMAPESMNLPLMVPKLFGDLFGLKSQRSSAGTA